MSLPDEQKRALKYAKNFLVDLLYKEKTPRVPFKFRQQACNILRHYPSDIEIDWIFKDKKDKT